MSLNRRLYAWLTGTDANGVPISIMASASTETGSLDRQDSEPSMDYFDRHSKSLLIEAVKRTLNSYTEEAQKPSFKLRPFKILMSLLDKPEIGSAILEDIFLDVLRCIYRECVTKTNDHCARPKNFQSSSSQKLDDSVTTVGEAVKTANLLLGSLEPSFIWQFIGQTLELACAGVNSDQNSDQQQQMAGSSVPLMELCTIVEFVLDKLSVVCDIVSFHNQQSLISVSALYLLDFLHFCNCLFRI